MSSDSSTALRIAIAGMVGMAVAMGIGRFVFTPILPGMMESLGLSASDAGLIASANYLGYLVGAVFAAGGWAQGRERSLMLAAIVASAVLAGLMGIAGDMAAFVAIRFLGGVASAFAMVFLSTIVFARLAALNREGFAALHFGGVGVGIAASSLMIGFLLLQGADWRAGWFWAAILSFVGAILVALLVKAAPAGVGEVGREPPIPGSPALTKIIVAYGLFGFGYIVTATFLIAIVRQGDGGRLFEAGVWLATGLAGIPSVWFWNRVGKKFGFPLAFGLACAVEAVGVIASVALGGYAGPLLGGVLLGGTFIAATALGLAAGRRLAGGAPRRVLALMTAAFGTGQIVGPVVAGYLADWTGDFLAASACAAAVLLVAAAIGSRAEETPKGRAG